MSVSASSSFDTPDAWLRSIEENQRLMRDALAADVDVDPEFGKILQNDIASLKKRIGQTDATRLDRLETSMKSLLGRLSVVVPLVGKLVSPTFLMSDDSSVINAGLQKLQEEKFQVRRVRGNGDCMFSSIATELMTLSFLEVLIARVPQLLQNKMLDTDPRDMFWHCFNAMVKNTPVEELLCDKQVNTAWVAFLQEISVNYWRQEIKKRPEAIVELALSARDASKEFAKMKDNEVCEKYLTSMADPRLHIWGGHPEIVAIGKLLQREIRVVGAEDLGGRTTPQKIEEVLPKARDPQDIWLLKRGPHYDSLYAQTI